MSTKRSTRLQRQEAYKARANAARLLGRIMFLALLGATSAAAWTEPKIKAQLETGLETMKPIVSNVIDSEQLPFGNQTASLEDPALQPADRP